MITIEINTYTIRDVILWYFGLNLDVSIVILQNNDNLLGGHWKFHQVSGDQAPSDFRTRAALRCHDITIIS